MKQWEKPVEWRQYASDKKRKFAWRKRIAEEQSLVDERDADMGESTELLPEERILQKEKEDAVRVAVKRLPDKYRLVVLLFYMEDLPTTQVAEVMKIPIGTVLNRLYQARKILRKELEDVLDGKSVE